MSRPTAARAAIGTTTLACLLVAAALLLGGRARVSQCTTRNQGTTLTQALSTAADCNDQRLLDGAGASCTPTAPPSCSRNLVGDAMALAYGAAELPPIAHDPDVLGDQFACQQAIGEAVASYTGLRLRYRINGAPPDQADALAAPALDPIASACAVSVARDGGGVVLPTVGTQCIDAARGVGANVDTAALRGCLRQLLGVWVERIGPDPRPLRPNIVMVMTDDQRFDATDGTHALPGQQAMPTVRSQVAGEGVEFTRGFVTTPLCCPARATLFSGQYAHQHGIQLGGAAELPEFDDTSTLAVWLQDAGYRTGLFGKYKNGYGNLWRPGESPYLPPGWDDWRAFSLPNYLGYELVENGVEVAYGYAAADYATDVLRTKLLNFINASAASGQPFFALYVPIAPHSPWQPAARHVNTLSSLAPYRPPSFNEADLSDKPWYLRNKPLQDPGTVDTFRKRQMETLRAVDEAVAAITQRLRQLGIEDDTVLIFTSDNGYFWGEHRLTAKHRPYEEAIRVPYMIRYPRLAPLPRRDAQLVTNLDFAPTFVELAGAVADRVMNGRSLVRALDGTEPAVRSDFLTEGWPDGFEWVTLRESRWKYTEYTNGVTELYDTLLDPYELVNVASDSAHATRIQAMAARIRQLRPGWPADVP